MNPGPISNSMLKMKGIYIYMTTNHALSVGGVPETSYLTVYFEKDDYIMEIYQY
jgi:hypothetical protein